MYLSNSNQLLDDLSPLLQSRLRNKHGGESIGKLIKPINHGQDIGGSVLQMRLTPSKILQLDRLERVSTSIRQAEAGRGSERGLERGSQRGSERGSQNGSDRGSQRGWKKVRERVREIKCCW